MTSLLILSTINLAKQYNRYLRTFPKLSVQRHKQRHFARDTYILKNLDKKSLSELWYACVYFNGNKVAIHILTILGARAIGEGHFPTGRRRCVVTPAHPFPPPFLLITPQAKKLNLRTYLKNIKVCYICQVVIRIWPSLS